MYIFWQEQISYWTKIYCQPCWRILRYIIQWDRVWLDIFLFSVRHTYLAPVTVHYSLITSFSRPPHILPRLACWKQNAYILKLWSSFCFDIIQICSWGGHQLIFELDEFIFCLSDNLSGGWILLQYIEGYKICIYLFRLTANRKKDEYPVH